MSLFLLHIQHQFHGLLQWLTLHADQPNYIHCWVIGVWSGDDASSINRLANFGPLAHLRNLSLLLYFQNVADQLLHLFPRLKITIRSFHWTPAS
jgi:hypothetical protein